MSISRSSSSLPFFWSTLTCLLLLGAGRLVAQETSGTARRAAAAKVQPGDRIHVHFLRERELSDTLLVNERGETVFPKLGVLHVSRLSIGEVYDTLRARYATMLREPELQVNVLRRITVNGEVKNPNVYYVDVTAGVREAIALAGGIVETGNPRKVTIVRGAQRIAVPRWQTSDAGNTDLRSGDQVVVGRKRWIAMNALPLISTGVLVISVAVNLLR